MSAMIGSISEESQTYYEIFTCISEYFSKHKTMALNSLSFALNILSSSSVDFEQTLFVFLTAAANLDPNRTQTSPNNS